MPLSINRPTLGDLRDYVTLDTPTFAANTHGAQTPTWGTQNINLFAAVWSVSGREALMAEATTAALSSVVWIPYQTGVSVKARILHGSRTLQIESVEDPDGRQQWLRLLCSEVQS